MSGKTLDIKGGEGARSPTKSGTYSSSGEGDDAAQQQSMEPSSQSRYAAVKPHNLPVFFTRNVHAASRAVFHPG